MPNRRAFLPAGTSSGSIAGPIPGGLLLMTPAPPTATWNGRHWRAAANTGVVRIRAVGGDYKRRADFRPAGVLPKQTDAIGGAGVWSPRSRKRSRSSPVAVRKNVTDVTRHAVCALRSGPPPRGTQYCQSASDTSTEVSAGPCGAAMRAALSRTTWPSRRPVWHRLGAIPERMRSAATASIFLFFCHPRPVNGYSPG
jgi:hypothetical protein